MILGFFLRYSDACAQQLSNTVLNLMPNLTRSPSTFEHSYANSLQYSEFLWFDEFCAGDCSSNSAACYGRCVRKTLIHDTFFGPVRIGEALHPGPLTIGSFNPTQLWGHMPTIQQWGPGIWGASETSATSEALTSLRADCRKAGLFFRSSDPVQHLGSSGGFRGRAGDTALISAWPIRPYPQSLPDAVATSTRFCDGVCSLGFGLDIYVAVLYGPTKHRSHENPWALLQEIMQTAVQRAAVYRGPAIIMGDFNVDIAELPHWPMLARMGWRDLADHSCQLFGGEPGYTSWNSNGAARKSFILGNDQAAAAMTLCQTCKLHTFAAHPVLEAHFDLDVLVRDRIVWHLPRDSSSLLIDPDTFDSACEDSCKKRCGKFGRAIAAHSPADALHCFAVAFDEALAQSSVTPTGEPRPVSRSYLGRCRGPLFRRIRAVGPVVARAREGDYQCSVLQPDRDLRLKVKQVRRLSSLLGLMANLEKLHSRTTAAICEELWVAIRAANGFPGGFPQWSLRHLRIFLPTPLPSRLFVSEILAELSTLVRTQEQQVRLQECRKFASAMVFDCNKGGKRAFGSIREHQSPPLFAFAHTSAIQVCRQRWPKTGLLRVRCQGDLTCFRAGLPVSFQDQQVFLRSIDAPFLLLDAPLKLRTQELVITQKHYTVDVQLMIQEAGDAWSAFWGRDDPEDDEQWDQACRFVTCLEDCPSCPYQDFTEDSWHDMLRGVKSGSARGSDGFTAGDLRSMHGTILQWLFQIFRLAEAGIGWPARLLQAKVTLLAKSDEVPLDPLATRPITVLSRLYRCWSRYRSLQVLAYLRTLMPASIAGGLAGSSADMLAAFTLCTLEDARMANVERCGAVLDIIKCYNAAPRWPLIALLARIGLPREYVVAFAEALRHLVRHLEILGQTSPDGVPSSTGIPEGCAFAVACMASISFLASRVVQADDSTVEAAFYADNWGVIADSVPELHDALQKLTTMLAAWRMDLSVPKSWLWGSHGSTRKDLESLQIDGQLFPVLRAGADLGCDMAYTGKVSKKVTRKRWGKAKSCLAKLRNKRYLPRSFKATMARSAGLGKALYGAELVHTTNLQWKELRGPIGRSMGYVGSGGSTLLALAVFDPDLDPQFANLVRTLRFWRRFMRIFPGMRTSFLDHLVISAASGKSGPAQALRKTFLAVGITPLAEGFLVLESGLRVAWLHDSWGALHSFLTVAWRQHVCRALAHRWDFDLSSFDPEPCLASLKDMTPQEQGILRTVVGGKNITHEVLTRYAAQVKSDRCPSCSSRDGRDHRILECDGHARVRTDCALTLRWLRQRPMATLHYGLCPAVDDLWLWKQEACGDFPALQLPSPSTSGQVYTDGSCFFNTQRTFAIAGFAVRRVAGKKSFLVAKGLVPGIDQTPYRGEAMAVLWALQNFSRLDLFADCEAVLFRFQKLLSRRLSLDAYVYEGHDDIWTRIWWHVLQRPPDSIVTHKVKAHVRWQSVSDPVLRDEARLNGLVDADAKSAIQDHPSGIFRRLEKASQQHAHLCAGVRAIHRFWATSCKQSLAEQPSERHLQGWQLPDPALLIPDGEVVAFVPFDVDALMAQGFPFGRLFCQRLCTWWNNLTWCQHSEPISILELYADFSLQTRSTTPGRTSKKPLRWELRDQSVAADLAPKTLGAQLRIWGLVLKWLFEVHPEGFPSAWIPRCSSMLIFGYKRYFSGFDSRPKLAYSSLAALWHYLHPPEGNLHQLTRLWPPASKAALGGA